MSHQQAHSNLVWLVCLTQTRGTVSLPNPSLHHKTKNKNPQKISKYPKGYLFFNIYSSQYPNSQGFRQASTHVPLVYYHYFYSSSDTFVKRERERERALSELRLFSSSRNSNGLDSWTECLDGSRSRAADFKQTRLTLEPKELKAREKRTNPSQLFLLSLLSLLIFYLPFWSLLVNFILCGFLNAS